MPMLALDPPRQAAADLLDLIGEVFAAARIVITDAMAWTRDPGPRKRLRLVPPLDPPPDDRRRSPTPGVAQRTERA
jgi:hypothetical protein